MISLGQLVFELGLKDSDFQKGFEDANKSMTSFANTATKTGKTLTQKVSLPIAGLGVAALKLAADFEVSSSKFSKAFDGAGEAAVLSIKSLNEEYGIAESTATSLLANTGDLLKGFGATSDEALKLSTSAQKLAASLAAYNGVPVVAASEAITKALVGERDSLKGLGVVVSEAAVAKQLLADGTSNLTGQELLLAKGQATLTIAMSQSTDAIGSFEENTNTAAFQTTSLLGDLKDLGVQFGTILLPVLKDAVGEVKDVVKYFSELDDETKTNIIKMAAFAAAIGPVLLGVGNLTKGILSSAKAIKTLGLAIASNPYLAIGVAVVAAVIKINEMSESTRNLRQEIKDTKAELAKKAAGEWTINDEIIEAQGTWEKLLAERENARGGDQRIYDHIQDLINQQAVKIYNLKEEIKETQKLSDAEANAIIIQARRDAVEAAATAAKQKAHDELMDSYVQQNNRVQSIINSTKTETQLIDEEIKSITTLGLAEGDLKEDQTAAILILENKKKKIISDADKAKKAADKQKVADQAAIDAEDLAKTQELYDAKKAIAAEQIMTVIDTAVNFVVTATGLGVDVFSENADELTTSLEDVNSALEDTETAASDISGLQATALAYEEQIRQQELAAYGAEQLGIAVEGYASAAEKYMAGDTMGAIITALTTLLQPAMESIGAYMETEMFDNFVNLGELFTSIGNSVATLVIPVLELIIPVFELLAYYGDTLLGVYAQLLPSFMPIIDLFVTLLEIFKPLIDLLGIILTVALIPMRVQLGVLGLVAEGLNFLLEAMGKLFSPVTDFFDDMLGFLKDLLDFNIIESTGNVFSNIGSGIKNLFGFDTGGTVTGGGATPIMVNESGSGELMLSGSSAGNALVDLFSARIANNISSMPINENLLNKLDAANSASGYGTAGNSVTGNSSQTINLTLDGKVIAKSTVDLINNRQYTVDKRSVR